MKKSERNPAHSLPTFNPQHEFRQKHWSALWFVLALVIGLGAALTSRAQVVAYDNLGPAPYGTTGYSSYGLWSDGYYYKRGIQFTATNTITLSKLELVLGEAYFAGVQSGTAKAELMTDTNNTPGSVLESWTSATISGSPTTSSLQTFASVQTPKLTAGKKYWVVLSDPPGSVLGGSWDFADDNHTGLTLVMYANVNTGSTSYYTLTRGFRTRVSGTAPVPLSITSTATNTIVVSWPSYAATTQLQSSTQVGAAANWTATIETPVTNGNFLQVTLPLGSTSQFFRLVK